MKKRVRLLELREICYQVGHSWERVSPTLMKCTLCRMKWKKAEFKLL